MAIDETDRWGGKVRFRVGEGFAKFRNDPRQSEPPECDVEAKGVRPGRGHKCNREWTRIDANAKKAPGL